MSVYCTLFSQTFYGLLFCYLTIADVHARLYLQIIDFQFPSCCTSQPPKNLNQIITVNSSTNIPRSYHQKNNSCTLCVPMFKHKSGQGLAKSVLDNCLYYIHFEITGYPSNVIGSRQCDLFPNHTIALLHLFSRPMRVAQKNKTTNQISRLFLN